MSLNFIKILFGFMRVRISKAQISEGLATAFLFALIFFEEEVFAIAIKLFDPNSSFDRTEQLSVLAWGILSVYVINST